VGQGNQNGSGMGNRKAVGKNEAKIMASKYKFLKR
jgi:hypothetical protein